jgi:hypothetical protein
VKDAKKYFSKERNLKKIKEGIRQSQHHALAESRRNFLEILESWIFLC